MTEIVKFDKPTALATMKAFQAHMKVFEETFGVKVEVGRSKFSDDQLTMPITMTVEGGVKREEELLKHYAKMDGIDITKVYDGYRLIEYHPRRHRYPYIALNTATGKRIKMPTEVAQQRYAA